MSDFRNTHIGVTNAARILGVSVTRLRHAILGETPLNGVMPPQPRYYAGARRSEMMFQAGDVMDCAEQMKANTSIA